MQVRRGLSGVALFALGLTIGLTTRVAGAQASPISDLLQRAKTALNDLQYPKADSLASEVLDLGTRLRRAQRITALEIVAAARFPEEREQRDTAGARAVLRELVRIEMDARFPEDLGWEGLGRLLDDVRASTFSFSTRMRADNSVVGLEPFALFHVKSTRPTVFKLTARAKDEMTTIPLDSTGPVLESDIRVQVLRDGRQYLPTGEYTLVLTGVDGSKPDTIVRRYSAVVLTPELNLTPIPALDSTRLLPEVERARRNPGIAAGVLTGAFSVAVGAFARDPDGKGILGRDSRAVVVGFLIAASTVAAVLRDPGRPLKANQAANAGLRRDVESRERDAYAENERRRSGYRASITLDAEERQ